jgi:hypothetical protein
MFDTLYHAMFDDAVEAAVPRVIAGMVVDLAQGRGDIRAVRHPLGFVCLPLERTGDRGVCVHVWSDRLTSANPTTSWTHAHSWDLISFVLYGTLRNELVNVTDTLDGATHRVFEVGTRAEYDEIRRTPRLVRRWIGPSELHHPGRVYTLPAGVFHETVAHGEVATIALGRGRPGAVDLTLGSIDMRTHRITRRLCDPDETAHAAAVVADRLADVPRPRHREYQCEQSRN